MTDPDRRVPMPPYFGSFQSQLEQQHAAKVSIGDDADELDDDEDDDDPDDDPEDDDPDDELDEDGARAELKRVRAALKKANASSARHRKRRREAETKTPKPKPKDDDGDDDVEARIIAARSEERTKAHTAVKKSGARAALVAAGVDPDRLERALRQVDLDDLDVDDETGEVDGLDDAIAELRDELPEWFTKKRRRRSTAGGRDDGDGSSTTSGSSSRRAGDKGLSATEQQARLLRG